MVRIGGGSTKFVQVENNCYTENTFCMKQAVATWIQLITDDKILY